MTDAATRDGSLRVTSRRKLCESPLALVPLSDRPEGPVIVLGHGDSWLARRSPGCQRMSVVRLDAPPGIAPATKFSPPVSDPSRRSRGESALAVVDGRLALVSPDLEQSDAASRCDADARLGEDGRVSNVKFLCQDIATGRAVTVTPYWVPHEDDENDPAKSDDDDAHTVWEIRAWPPSSRPPEEAEDDDTAASLASDYVLDARPSPRFRVTALASCHPPKGVIGGIIAVGTSQLPVTYKRRQHGPPEPEGRLFIFGSWTTTTKGTRADLASRRRRASRSHLPRRASPPRVPAFCSPGLETGCTASGSVRGTTTTTYRPGSRMT